MSAQNLDAVPGSSLYEEALHEAERHKWIESQKQGRDLGEQAIRDWFRRFWPVYRRCKLMEHVRGQRRWREFGDEDFGQLYSLILAGDLLVDRIMDRLDFGMENLNIITWAFAWGLPMNRVGNILRQINVNRAHLDPRR